MHLEDWRSLDTAGYMTSELMIVVRPAALFHFATACLRRVWDHLSESDRRAVAETEDYARGLLAVVPLLVSWTEAELVSGDRLWSMDYVGGHYCCPDCDEHEAHLIPGGVVDMLLYPAH